MPENIEVNTTVGDLWFQIYGTAGTGKDLNIRFVGEPSRRQLDLSSMLMAVMNAYARGLELELLRPITDLHCKDYSEKIYKCRWSKGGKLSLLDDDYSKKYLHANSVQEAITRSRVFTCSESVYAMIPKVKTTVK